jgi:HEAT repeat protein
VVFWVCLLSEPVALAEGGKNKLGRNNELAIYLGCVDVNFAGAVVQLDASGKILGIVELPHGPSDLAPLQDGLVAAVPGRPSQVVRIDAEGQVRPILRTSSVIAVAVAPGSGDILLGSNSTDALMLLPAGGTPKTVFQIKGHDDHYQAMSVALTKSGHILFGGTGPNGVYRFRPGDATMGTPIDATRFAHTVRVDPMSERWLAAGKTLKVYEGSSEVLELSYPRGTWKRYDPVAFGPGGELVVALMRAPAGRPYAVYRVDLEKKAFRPLFSWGESCILSLAVARKMSWRKAKTAAQGKPQDVPPAKGPYALAFDGHSFVSIPSLRYDGNRAITLEAKVTLPPDYKPGEGIEMVIANLQNSGLGFGIHKGRWRVWSCEKTPQGARYASVASQDKVVLGRPVHAALVYATVFHEPALMLFVDGELVGVARRRGNPVASPFPFMIGASPTEDGWPWRFSVATIDEVRISSTGRYNRTFEPPRRFQADKDTLALYHFDEGEGSVAYDSSGNGRHGTIHGARWVTAPADPSPPTADEATVTELLRKVGDKDKRRSGRARRTLVRMGSEAVPPLLAALNGNDTGVRVCAASVLAALRGIHSPNRPEHRAAVDGLVEAVAHADERTGRAAAQALASVLEESRYAGSKRGEPFYTGKAIPALVKALAVPSLSADAALALARIGPSAVPALRRALRATDAPTRIGAVLTLTKTRKPLKEMTPDLLAALEDPDAGVRALAAEAMGRLRGNKAAVEGLAVVLRDPDPRVREAVIAALGKLGHEGLVALAELGPAAFIGQLASEDPATRARAMGALERMGTEVVPALLEALQSEHGLASQGAVDVLARMTRRLPVESQAVVFDAMIAALEHKHAGTRQAAAAALMHFTERRRPWEASAPAPVERTVPALVKALGDQDARVRAAAARTLATVGPRAKPAVSALIEMLRDADRKCQSAAVVALSKLGSDAAAAIPALEALAKNPALRFAALRAVANMGEAGVPILMKALHDDDAAVRYHAVSAVAYSNRLEVYGSALAMALRDEDQRIRRNAARFLTRASDSRGEELAAAVPALAEAAADSRVNVREAALHVLARIGAPASAPAVPVMIGALADEDKDVRHNAVWALWRAGEAAVPALLEALHSESVRVRRGATKSLLRMQDRVLQRKVAEIAPGLVIALRDQDAGVRGLAAETLGELPWYARQSTPGLTEALRDPVAQVRLAAAGSLVSFGSRGRSARPVLAEALKTVLEAALKAEDDGTWEWVRPFLKRWSRAGVPEVAEAVAPVLAEAAGHEDKRIRSAAIEFLRYFGASAKPAVPGLIVGLRHSEADVRAGAAKALGKIGPVTRTALPALVEAANDTDSQVRRAAVEALANFGADARPALLEAQRDKDPQVRRAAAKALRSLER